MVFVWGAFSRSSNADFALGTPPKIGDNGGDCDIDKGNGEGIDFKGCRSNFRCDSFFGGVADGVLTKGGGVGGVGSICKGRINCGCV